MNKSAMILAAGLGLRMRPLTNHLPKPLISVAGKSMLAWTYDHLKKENISNIVVNAHYLAPLIVKRAKELCPHILISQEDILLETGGGIKKALPLLENDPFFVLNGDSLWTESTSLAHMETQWSKDQMEALLLLIPREKAHGYEGQGDFLMDSQKRLCRPEKGQNAPYVYIGVQLISPKLFQHSPDGPFSINLLWDQALEKGRLYGHLHEGDWFHISTPQDLEKFEPMIASIPLTT
jgi:MurNAc alpha-1-phosphate uridylyltransferase